MIGITSYGGYIPRRRMSRTTIYQNMGWYTPATIAVAQGERSFCNWDEDSITMAVAACRDCLNGRDKNAIDGLYLCSTSLPFADRLNAAVVKGALNLRDDIATGDFTASLKSGTTALATALEVVRSGGFRNVLVATTDHRISKAGSFYEMWLGDGAAALTVGAQGVIAEYLGGHSISADFVDHHRGEGKRFDYTWEERWVRDEGFSKLIPAAIQGLLAELSLTMDEVDKLIFPCFFKAERLKIAKQLGAAADKVVDNMHEVCGDCGTAHPFVLLVRALEDAQPGERLLVAGFGQGADALCFRVTDEIRALPRRQGVSGWLENGKAEANYTKFLKFRDLIAAETGIRAEAPSQTASSVLWRNRKMLFGLIGGLCKTCGAAQFPKMDICVNPDCRARDTQADYEFADRRAVVKTFTGDFLAVSEDPPAIYGMIQFEGGGRMLADFTDCELDDIHVGQPMEMSFRRRYTDEARGFSGYFWKAVPQRGERPAEVAAAGTGRR